MIAPSDSQPRAAPRFQICSTGSLRGRQWPTGLWHGGKKKEKTREKGQGGRIREGDRRGEIRTIWLGFDVG